MSRAAADAVFPHVHTDGFAFDIELLALAHRRGFVRLEECPVRVDLAFPSGRLGPVQCSKCFLTRFGYMSGCDSSGNMARAEFRFWLK